MLRTQLAPDMTFAALLRTVRDVTLDSFSNQELPFELLGTRVPPLRALFSMQDARERPRTMGVLEVEQFHVPQHFATNDLMLWMMETRTQLHAVLNYSTELFERASAETFVQHLRAVLLSVLENPAQDIGRIALSAASGPTATHETPSASATSLPTVIERIERIARETPDRVALTCDGTTLTFADLVARARRVAAGLSECGVSTDTPVEVALPVGADRVVAMLGVLGVGAAVMLSDLDDATEYRRAMTFGAHIAVRITAGRAQESDGCRDGVMAELLTAPERAFVAPVADASAVIVSCLGADGSAEIRRVTHGVLAAQAAELAVALRLNGDDVVAVTSAASTSTAVLQVLSALIVGASVLIASEDAREDGDELAAELSDGNANVVFGHSEVWQRLLATNWRATDGARAVLVAGALPQESVLAEVSLRSPDAYTLFTLPADPGVASLVPIRSLDGCCHGAVTGMAGARFDVVDADDVRSPLAIPGRLRVAHGADARVSGVGARVLVDGRLQLLRGDPAYAESGGVSASTAGVEQAIARHAGVMAAAVTTHADASGARLLVAYVVLQPGTRFQETELRAVARQHLPRLCVPRRFVEVAALPKHDDGTVQYDALENPFLMRSATREKAPEPRNETEAMLANVWKAVLGVESVGPHDNFFRLGGTSLLCFRVVEQVRTASGLQLSPRALLVGTLEQAAAELHAQKSNGQSNSGAARDEPQAALLTRLRGLVR